MIKPMHDVMISSIVPLMVLKAQMLGYVLLEQILSMKNTTEMLFNPVILLTSIVALLLN
jgi:hypothetical protein